MSFPRSFPDDDRDLESFATVLAEHLPGNWMVEYHPHQGDEDQFRHAEDVWDLNLVSGAIAEFVLREDAHLIRQDGTRLYVTIRPLHDDEFLVAAIAPTGSIAAEAFEGVREPDGIAVPGDPERAAHAVTADLLPRYEVALAQVRHAVMNPPQPASRPDTTVVMTWREDGSLAATTTARPASEVLLAEGFVWETASNAYVLAGDDTRAQGHAVQAAGARLARLGIGVALRTAPRPAADVALPASQPGGRATVRNR
ncbi:hypothetical protein [Streptomyces sp. NRRL F-5193]|uniref:hypothetical protein n=1 Tax=Streptomyces sp. NRRL F-5193 TaxID=1463860 RepID=UPI00068ED438|nr:hypothetical protein [Streptomyces sp. NRRL F-5193]